MGAYTEKQLSKRNPQKGSRIQVAVKGKNPVKWWVGTVILTFFPTISVAITGGLRGSPLDLLQLIGDGELILSSFLVAVSTLINDYNINKEAVSKQTENAFYGLLLVSFLQLIAYTTIKTNEKTSLGVVLVVSSLCIITSVVISYFLHRFMEREALGKDA